MSLDHEARRKTLGASEIAAACGKSPYQSRKQLWAIKTGRAKPFGGNQYTYWGNVHEPGIAAKYAEEHPDVDVSVVPGTQMNDKPWAATPDRLIRDYKSIPHKAWLLEIKSADKEQEVNWGPSGSQEIPEHYHLQVQWQMYVCGMDRCDVAVLIGGNDYREYTFKRDPQEIDKLIQGAEDFWGYVERDEEPPEDVKDDRPAIEPTPDIIAALNEKLHNAKVRAEAEKCEKDARNRLVKLIPQGSKCSTESGSASWSERKGMAKTDWEAAFWATNKENPIAQSVVESFTNTTDPVWVLTVKGKK